MSDDTAGSSFPFGLFELAAAGTVLYYNPG